MSDRAPGPSQSRAEHRGKPDGAQRPQNRSGDRSAARPGHSRSPESVADFVWRHLAPLYDR